MSARGGRPTLYETEPKEISFKVDKTVHADIKRYARNHGLSVPMYTAMMMTCHRNQIEADEREAAELEAARAVLEGAAHG
jgi:hypothetical protein